MSDVIQYTVTTYHVCIPRTVCHVIHHMTDVMINMPCHMSCSMCHNIVIEPSTHNILSVI